jgi:hypothetical protein
VFKHINLISYIVIMCMTIYFAADGRYLSAMILILMGIFNKLTQIHGQISESRMFDKHSFTEDELRVLKAALINMKKPERGNLS